MFFIILKQKKQDDSGLKDNRVIYIFSDHLNNIKILSRVINPVVEISLIGVLSKK